MSNLVIGNILCFVAATIMTLMGLIKDRVKFLEAQSVMNAVYIAAYAFLGGVSGVIVNAITMTRNIVCLKWKMTMPLKLIFISVQVGLAVYFGTHGFVAWFPVIACSIFTWFMDTDDIVLLKYVIIGTQLLFLAYDWYVKGYAAVPFDILATATNTLSLVQLIKAKRAETEEEKGV